MCRPENSLLICDKLHGILVVDVSFSEYYMHRYSIKLFFASLLNLRFAIVYEYVEVKSKEAIK